MSIAIQDEIKVFENEPEELEESNDEVDGNRGSFDLEQVPQGQRTRRSSIFTITSIGHYAHQATNEVVHTVGQLQHEASKVSRIPIRYFTYFQTDLGYHFFFVVEVHAKHVPSV